MVYAICRPDFEAGLEDFKIRLANYEKVQNTNFPLVTVQAWLHTITCFLVLHHMYPVLQAYEPVEEGSYIKMIDMVSGHGGQIQVSMAYAPFLKND